MGKLKIHEIAKELGVGSKEVIAKAKELGIEVTSHLSSVEEEIVNKIRNAFGAKAEKQEKSSKNAEKESKDKKQEKTTKKDTATPVIIRREVILADEETESKKEKNEPRKDVGFVERKKNQDYNIVYRKQPVKPMTVSELFGIKNNQKEEPKKEEVAKSEETKVTIEKQEVVQEVVQKEEKTKTVEVKEQEPVTAKKEPVTIESKEKTVNQPANVHNQNNNNHSNYRENNRNQNNYSNRQNDGNNQNRYGNRQDNNQNRFGNYDGNNQNRYQNRQNDGNNRYQNRGGEGYNQNRYGNRQENNQNRFGNHEGNNQNRYQNRGGDNNQNRFGNGQRNSYGRNNNKPLDNRGIDRNIKDIMATDIVEKEDKRDISTRAIDKQKAIRYEDNKAKKGTKTKKNDRFHEEFNEGKLKDLKQVDKLSHMFNEQDGGMLDYYDLTTARGKRNKRRIQKDEERTKQKIFELKEITIPEMITVKDLAAEMKKSKRRYRNRI